MHKEAYNPKTIHFGLCVSAGSLPLRCNGFGLGTLIPLIDTTVDAMM